MTPISITAKLCCGAGWRDSDWRFPGRNIAPFQAPAVWECLVRPDQPNTSAKKRMLSKIFPAALFVWLFDISSFLRKKKALHRISDERHCSTTALSLSLL
jgi:hypothetical protein